ncbi:hypothetical protein ACS0TY_003213 [Phlomoides rotata]
MAFHVACPITCRKVCFCALGFPGRLRNEKGKEDFLQEVARVEQFLKDPWLIKARENATVQVKVPKVVVAPTLPPPIPHFAADASLGAEDSAAAVASAQVKRVALQKQAAAASMVAEDYVRRFESGDLETPAKDAAGEEQGLSTTKVMCRLCFSGEYEGSERARKMLSCNSCSKKYHRNCVKSWSQNRDLFHWSSWTCPSCRMCEVCRRTGDPNKLMFCKRCDGAYHCYCQQPPHKNVGRGPYLCPKHTKCHSCGSSVPGNGLSVRWFLGYTCCDACGRLFVKDNYCPVCLKVPLSALSIYLNYLSPSLESYHYIFFFYKMQVYRDSESTPMVCCDICQRWVHCPCDGISDAKYMQFQVDGNLQYVCPTCRGECPQIRNLEEAVQELWRRRDEADKDLIASMRAAAGLPTQEEIFDISPFSDDEDSGPPLVKNEHARSLKFSLKGLDDKSSRKSKEKGKKSSNKKSGKKKGNGTSSISIADADGRSGKNAGIHKNKETLFSGEPDGDFSPHAGSLTESAQAVNEATISKQKHVGEASATNITKTRTIKIKSNTHGLTNREEIGSNSGVPRTAQGPKLVIHLSGRSRNTTGEDLTSSKAYKTDHADRVKGSKLRGNEGHMIKLKNSNSEPSNISSKLTGGEFSEGYESVSPKYLGVRKRSTEDSASDVPVSKRSKHSSFKHAADGSVSGDLIDDSSSSIPSMSQATIKDHKPFLKFKIPKNSNNGNQNVPSNANTGNQIPLPLAVKDEITYTRGQRSKRRRPAPGDEDALQGREDSTVNDFADANWILQKLGKDAAGKRVEIHQPSNNSWHRGTVIEVLEGTSTVSIALDDGNTKNFELGKQGIRFVSQKQKH